MTQSLDKCPVCGKTKEEQLKECNSGHFCKPLRMADPYKLETCNGEFMITGPSPNGKMSWGFGKGQRWDATDAKYRLNLAFISGAQSQEEEISRYKALLSKIIPPCSGDGDEEACTEFGIYWDAYYEAYYCEKHMDCGATLIQVFADAKKALDNSK